MSLHGAELTLDPSGAAWWAERATLLVADLHLGRGPSTARASQLLPPHDRHSTVGRLALVLRRYRPDRVIVLGSGLDDGEAAPRMTAEDAALIERLVSEHEWMWIVGNPESMPAPRLGGALLTELALEPLILRHKPEAGHVAGEVCGYFHPMAAVRVRGRRLSGRSFVTDGERLVLPAFGSHAGGTDALDPAIRELFERQVRVYLIGRDGIYLYAAERLEGVRRAEPVAVAR